MLSALRFSEIRRGVLPDEARLESDAQFLRLDSIQVNLFDAQLYALWFYETWAVTNRAGRQ